MQGDDGLVVARGVTIPLAEVELRTSRSSGPGGQHANVTASRVEAVFAVDASQALSAAQKARVRAQLGDRVTAVAQDERSQTRNRELALERLAGKLAAAVAVPKARRPTKPTRGSKVRRLEAKRQTGERKAARRGPADD